MCICAVQDKQQDDDDLEAILAELDGKPQPAQAPSAMDSAAAPASAERIPAEPPAEDAENTAVSSLQLPGVFGIPSVLLAAVLVRWCCLSFTSVCSTGAERGSKEKAEKEGQRKGEEDGGRHGR